MNEHVDGLQLHSCGNFAHIECNAATQKLFFRCYHCNEDTDVDTAPDAAGAPFRIITFSATRNAKVPIRRIVNRHVVFDKTLQRKTMPCEHCARDTPFAFVLTNQADMTFARICEKCFAVS